MRIQDLVHSTTLSIKEKLWDTLSENQKLFTKFIVGILALIAVVSLCKKIFGKKVTTIEPPVTTNPTFSGNLKGLYFIGKAVVDVEGDLGWDKHDRLSGKGIITHALHGTLNGQIENNLLVNGKFVRKIHNDSYEIEVNNKVIKDVYKLNANGEKTLVTDEKWLHKNFEQLNKSMEFVHNFQKNNFEKCVFQGTLKGDLNYGSYQLKVDGDFSFRPEVSSYGSGFSGSGKVESIKYKDKFDGEFRDNRLMKGVWKVNQLGRDVLSRKDYEVVVENFTFKKMYESGKPEELPIPADFQTLLKLRLNQPTT